jgi:predicted metalloprotease
VKIALPGRRSPNLQDRRGQSAGGFGMGRGMGMPLPIGLASGLGLPGILLLLALFVLPQLCSGGGGFGVNQPFDQFPGVQPAAPGEAPLPGAPDADAELVDFVSFVLDDVQALWTDEFRRAGMTYEDAQLVLFTDAVQSGCGAASSATGPFYCSLDNTAYLDLGFFRELSSRFGAPGDFAQAYVLAHEIAHHVQNLTGTSAEVRRLSQENPDDANELSVRQELQADCLAGVWGSSTYERGLLEQGDLEEGLTAAAAVGDDRIQRQAGVRVDRETWTHGSSEERSKWFRRGFDSGDASKCDTFG